MTSGQLARVAISGVRALPTVSISAFEVNILD